MDPTTGEVITAEYSEDFRRYLQQHEERRQTGTQADELVKLVAKCNPRVEEEHRIYIGRFPWEARSLIAQGKQVYKKALAKQRHGGSMPPRLPSCATAKRKRQRTRKKKKKGKKEKKQKKKSKKDKHDTSDAGDPTKKNNVQQDSTEAEDPVQKEVDWGDDDSEAELDSKPTAAADMGGHDSDIEDVPDTSSPEAPPRENWPWKEQRRPSDRASSRTPSRSPRKGKVSLQPGPMWRAVQQVQRHMLGARQP